MILSFRRSFLLAALLPLLAACAAAPAPIASAPGPEPVWGFENSDIPVDPAYRFGVLDNGMRYAIRANATTKGTATGLDRIGKVTTFESAHTARNYILDEMVHIVGQRHSQKLRVIATLFLGVIPVLLLLGLPASMPVAILALVSHLIGLFASRWLFFAEAEHVVSLYYQRG